PACDTGAMALAIVPLDPRGISALSVAHIFNDMSQSAIPAILPFLILHQGLSLASAATLILGMNLSSSVVQPLFGYWSDRRSLTWVIPASMVVGALGTASIGLMHSFGAMFAAAVVAGIGVAAFHPESSRYANYVSGSRRATGMAWFTLGGYGGFALGPLLVTPLLLAFGLPGTIYLAIPGIVVAIAIAFELPRLRTFRRFDLRRQSNAVCLHDRWRPFGILTAVVSLRSTAFFGAVTFLPLFFINVLHATAAQGNAALTTMLLCGAIGTLVGGRLADHYERRGVIAFSIASVAAFASILAVAGGMQLDRSLVLAIAGLFGFGISLSASVLVVLGQEYLPNRIGVASGVTLGLAVSVGGIAAPLFGLLGDHYGLVAVFYAIASIAVLSFISALFLPSSRPTARARDAEEVSAA
ncbi:MAG: MFS transporter, partial [Candidatus Eremiobacteraeota bacterium]|nr:MFS transporter [Candidatus Eremiobacteraeota bacterium]